MRARTLILLLSFAAAGCSIAPLPPSAGTKVQPVEAVSVEIDARRAVNDFIVVARAIGPVAEDLCRARAMSRSCDFRIVVDDAPGAPPNAFQTVDEAGNPVIAFTVSLLVSTQNQDELAFIMAHEAAHHILNHLGQQRRYATIGAVIFGRLAEPAGAEAQRTAQEIGATLGARTYSKDFELQADALGTQITLRGGFDPLRGAAFFARIPDPGNRFLGTHPGNAERLATVQRVAGGL